MNRYAIFTLLWQNVVLPIDGATQMLIAGSMGWVRTWFQVAVLGYLMFMLMVAAWSADEEAFTRFYRAVFLAAVIYTLATAAETFNYYVSGLAQGIITGWTGAIATVLNHGAPADANAFDILMMRAFSVGLATYNQLPGYSFKSLGLILCVCVYWGFAFAAITIAFAISLLSAVAGKFLVGVGPVFIACYFFPPLRKWFDGWLACLMATVLVQVFSAALSGMFMFTLGIILQLASTGLKGTDVGAADGGAVIGEIMMLMVTGMICFIFALLAVAIVYVAARITGGAHAALQRFQAPAWMSAFPGGGSPASNAAPAAEAPRAYPFTHTIGPAP